MPSACWTAQSSYTLCTETIETRHRAALATLKQTELPSSGGRSTKLGAGVGSSAAIGPRLTVCAHGRCSKRALMPENGAKFLKNSRLPTEPQRNFHCLFIASFDLAFPCENISPDGNSSQVVRKLSHLIVFALKGTWEKSEGRSVGAKSKIRHFPCLFTCAQQRKQSSSRGMRMLLQETAPRIAAQRQITVCNSRRRDSAVQFMNQNKVSSGAHISRSQAKGQEASIERAVVIHPFEYAVP